MASKYLQKYPVPQGFNQILHDFTREVLRDQPEDIIKYGVEYFESMRDGKPFKFESKYNIAKGQSPAKKHLPPKPTDHAEEARRVVEVSNQRNEQPVHGRQKSETSMRQSSAGSHPEEKRAAREYVKELYQKVEQDIEEIEEGKIEANSAFFNPQFDEKDMEKIVKIQASAKGMLVRSHLKQTQETIKPQVVYQEEEEEVNVEAPQKPQEDGDYDQ